MNPRKSWGRRLLRRLTKPWHLLMAWFLARKIRRQHRELAKYIRRSAYEIAAWKQDIGFLDEQLRRHLLEAGGSVAKISPPELKTTIGDLQDNGADEILRDSVAARYQADEGPADRFPERRAETE